MTKAAKKTATKKTVKRAAPKANGTTYNAKIISMMKRPSGVTRAEVLKLTSWKAVSMQQQAAAGGVRLKMEKVEGKPTVYRCN